MLVHHSPFTILTQKTEVFNQQYFAQQEKIAQIGTFCGSRAKSYDTMRKVTGKVGAFHILENPLRFFKWAMPFLKEPTPILVWLKVSLSVSSSNSAAFYKIYVGVPWVGSMDTPDPVRKYESCVLSPTLLFRR